MVEFIELEINHYGEKVYVTININSIVYIRPFDDTQTMMVTTARHDSQILVNKPYSDMAALLSGDS